METNNVQTTPPTTGGVRVKDSGTAT